MSKGRLVDTLININGVADFDLGAINQASNTKTESKDE
jgi:hypothetical protein